MIEDFDLQTDHLIPARRPHLKEFLMDFAVSAGNKVKIKESEKTNKYLDLVREVKKITVEYKGNGNPSWSWCANASSRSLV